MFSRLKSWVVFHLEQTMMRGPLSRFALIALLVLFIAVSAGLLIGLLAPGFQSIEDAVWWAFLRLTDPGYLGDDEGTAKRTISTVLILFNYILFTGTLIAIIVQWLTKTMARLERGVTPITLNQHIVVLGWTSRTATLLEEILISEGRVERFLRRRGGRGLRLALLAEEASGTLMQEVKLQLGEHWNIRKIILRSGSTLRLDHLQRVDFAHAAAILIPAADAITTGPIHADARTMKTLMTLGAALAEAPAEEAPIVVAEIQDSRQTRRARALFKGPLEIVAGDEVISRLMVQNVRNPGLSQVYAQLLTDAGGTSQIYVRDGSELAGTPIQQLAYAFPRGVLLGVVRPEGAGFRALLNPANDMRLQSGDRLAVLAPSYKDAAPPEQLGAEVELKERPAPKSEVRGRRRVLLLGWNHRVPVLLSEFASYPEERFEIDIASQVSTSKRKAMVEAHERSTEQLQVRHLELDFTASAYHLETLEPASYDDVILLASSRLKPGAESDAQTILGYLLLQDLTPTGAERPRVLVELMDPDNVALFEGRPGELIVSPVIISHMLARVALRRELRCLFDELFSSGGSEILFRDIAEYDLEGGEYTFADLQRAADARGEIAIGLRRVGEKGVPDGGVQLNPRRDERLRLNEGDDLIVLTTYG